MKAIANQATTLKLQGFYRGIPTWNYQSSELPADSKLAIPLGQTVELLTEYEEDESATPSPRSGHIGVAYGGRWYYAFSEHFNLESQIIVTKPHSQPEWQQVDWDNFSAPVSKYFTVGEVTNLSTERIPHDAEVQKNIIKIARKMDEIREWWDGPLGVNSWYRPWTVNRRIGSNAPNHPSGTAVDFRPLSGSVWQLQSRFKAEWFESGKWQGGFGLGASKGFIHVDLRGRRMWNY